MTEQGKTLWEIMMDKLFGTPELPPPPPLHTQLCNPLNAKLGQFINLDLLDYRGKDFQIASIRAYKVVKNKTTFNFAEYVLTIGEQVSLLRILPGKTGLKALILELWDEFGADTEAGEAVSNIVKNDTEFNVDNDEKDVHEKYWRVDDVKSSYLADITVLDDSGMHQFNVEYWDYWRESKIDGVDTTQYLYVERNRDNGWLCITKGLEIDPNRVTHF
jgi:hypothetical protein